MMFQAVPTYNRYRPLKTGVAGEDVFAWQTVLGWLGFPTDTDGRFGPDTLAQTEAAQTRLGLVDDGVVGPLSWHKAVDKAARHFKVVYKVATGALYGSLAHESSLLGGNYSAARADGSFDAGVAQRNTKHTPAVAGFDVPLSIEALAKNTRDYHNLFEGVEDRRRWVLAQGAWNAPAFACYYAKAEGATKVGGSQTAKPSAAAAVLFKAYLDDVSAYLRV